MIPYVGEILKNQLTLFIEVD